MSKEMDVVIAWAAQVSAAAPKLALLESLENRIKDTKNQVNANLDQLQKVQDSIASKKSELDGITNDIDKTRSKLVQEAKNLAAQLEANAKLRANALIDAAKQEATDISNNLVGKASELASLKKQTQEAQAKLDQINSILNAKKVA